MSKIPTPHEPVQCPYCGGQITWKDPHACPRVFTFTPVRQPNPVFKGVAIALAIEVVGVALALLVISWMR